MAVIFPDIELTIVNYLQTAIPEVRVATKRAQPDEEQPAYQVIVNASYNSEQNFVLKEASLTLEILANNYADANDLALYIEALIRGVVGDQIKSAEVRMGPSRVEDDSTYERRMIDVALMVKGNTF